MPLSRRTFLVSATSLAAAALMPLPRVLAQARFADYPFTLGVASGYPQPDGVVLWTRLAPRPLEGGGMPPQPVEVAWQVAENEQMTKGVRSGRTIATPQW